MRVLKRFTGAKRAMNCASMVNPISPFTIKITGSALYKRGYIINSRIQPSHRKQKKYKICVINRTSTVYIESGFFCQFTG